MMSMVVEWTRMLGETRRASCAELGGDHAFFGVVKKRAPNHAQPRPKKAAHAGAHSFKICGMNPGDPRPLLDRHAARILTLWREHLRALPPSSALAAPEMLAPLMAPALARVRFEAALHFDDAPDEPENNDCRCGLNPLVAFYFTGETSTFEVLWSQPEALAPLTPEAREKTCRVLREAWRRVAIEEVSLFCSICQRGAAMDAADRQQYHPADAHDKQTCVGATEETLSAWARVASEAARGKS